MPCLPQAHNQNNQSDRPVGLVFLFPFLCFSSSFLRLLNCFFFPLLFSSTPGSSSGIPSLSYNTCVALRCRRVVFFHLSAHWTYFTPIVLPATLLLSSHPASIIESRGLLSTASSSPVPHHGWVNPLSSCILSPAITTITTVITARQSLLLFSSAPAGLWFPLFCSFLPFLASFFFFLFPLPVTALFSLLYCFLC